MTTQESGELDIFADSTNEPSITDELETEFREVQEAKADPKPSIPSKFEGKSAEEIAESYKNLEKELGRKNQEVGELRKLTDQYLTQELNKQRTPEVQDFDIEFDDLVDNPKSAVSKVVQPKLDELEKQIAQLNTDRKRQAFEAKHPNYMETVQDFQFQEWIAKSPYRLKMYETADVNSDFDAADALLSEWHERQDLMAAQAQTASKQKREGKLKDAAVESVGSSAPSSKKFYRRSDLINLRLKDPEKWESLSDEIYKAYQEGRVK